MYVPRHFAPESRAAVDRLIRSNPFGLLLSVGPVRPLGTHVPFTYTGDTLRCHLARANPQARQLRDSGDVMAVFQGPHHYVSPTWYGTPGVPTWNYAVAHVYGRATLIDDPNRLAEMLHALTDEFERNEPVPWQPDYDIRKLEGIVAVEIAVTEIEGKFKLNQNRSRADRRAVIERLRAKGSEDSLALAALMHDALGDRADGD